MKKFVLVCLVSLFTATISAASMGHSPTIKESVKSEVIKTDVLAMDVTFVYSNQTNFVEPQYTNVTFVEQTNFAIVSDVITPSKDVFSVRDFGKENQTINKSFTIPNAKIANHTKKENKKLTDSWC